MSTILIVDDDLCFLESTRDLLEACDYTVLTATNGTEALSILATKKAELVILDVMMTTDTEGFDVARKIRDTRGLRNVPILLVTGIVRALHLPPQTLQSDARWLPVDRIMDKPVDPSRLIKEVERLLNPRDEKE